MKPYYDDGTCVIYHGDCRDLFSQFDKAIADLIVTDPPYGVRWRSSFRTLQFDEIANDDGDLDVPAVLDVGLDCLRVFRHAYVFGRFDWSKSRLRQTVELIWDKGMTGPGDLTLPWGPAHEVITFGVFVPSEKNTRDGYGRLSARLRQGSVIRCQRLNASEVALHPTEKPVVLLRQLIESSSVLGECVMDPFMGCGSTLIAAVREGRKAIGIELEEKYCEIAAKRLAQGALDLFGEQSA